jgi:hypothetical protein
MHYSVISLYAANHPPIHDFSAAGPGGTGNSDCKSRKPHNQRTLREAFRTYRAGRIRAVLDASQQAGRQKGHMGYTPDDVAGLIHQTRKEDARKLRRR